LEASVETDQLRAKLKLSLTLKKPSAAALVQQSARPASDPAAGPSMKTAVDIASGRATAIVAIQDDAIQRVAPHEQNQVGKVWSR
jgi:hypothetical protein